MCIRCRVRDPDREVFIVSKCCYILIEGLAFCAQCTINDACLICINFNKYIPTLIKQIFDGSPSRTLYIC